MTRRASVWGRTGRLEAMSRASGIQAEVARLATERGIPAEQLWTEAETLAGRFARQGDPRAVCDAVAAERGLDPEAVWTETQRILAG